MNTDMKRRARKLPCVVCEDIVRVPLNSGPSVCHTCVNFFEMGFRGRCRKIGNCEVTYKGHEG